MEYNSVLKRLEEQRKDQNLSTKLYRYTGLIKAIEFFSQRLNFDQIIDSAFDFVNEMLTLEKSAVFIINEDRYVLKNSKGIDTKIDHIPDSDYLKDIPILHGTLIYGEKRIKKYFDPSVMEAFKISIVIPFIIENELYGFIFISNKTSGELNNEDFIICEALMKLFNNALEDYRKYQELRRANNELDEKIFNLFAINQSSKALLSELNLDVLYDLSVDVFSELTQSSITGFVLYDEKSENYNVKAFKDIFYRSPDKFLSFNLAEGALIDESKVIIDISDSRDIEYFNRLFEEGAEVAKALGALYIVMLIKKGRILGFVTLGPTTTGFEYKKSIFELIESMASATYIALSNASLFNQVSQQQKIIQNKLEKVVSLNNLVKNINSSANIDTLLELTLKTLEISFEVEAALIALYDRDKNVLKITEKLNVESNKKEIKIKPRWEKVFEGNVVFEAKEEGLIHYFDKTFINKLEKKSGVLIIPIYIERIDVELIGTLVIFKFKNTLINDEENVQIMETVANHIAPVINNLYSIEQQKRFLLPNHIELFKRDLKSEINEALECYLKLQVVQVINDKDFVFIENTIYNRLKDIHRKVYSLTYNDTFIILNDDRYDLENEIKSYLGTDKLKVRTYVLGKDFKNYQDFFKLF